MPTSQPTTVRLTQLSHGAGCACKLGASELRRVLHNLVPFDEPAVLVDAALADDAAVYRLDGERALVATADFFAPIVDDPYDFGRIAATNALSDVYAMGGRPLFALNLVGFPRKLLGDGILEEIVRGGGVAARAAGIPVVGGHSVDDAEPKYGMCVIGLVHPERVVRNAGARVGDRLILTKPLGTGVIATALRAGAAPAVSLAAAVASMTALNRDAAAAMLAHDAHAATDVTGFGLMGHLGEVLRASGVAANVRASAVPLLPGAHTLAAAGHISGGTRRNLADADTVDWGATDEVMQLLLCDAQTSGGLLMSMAPERARACLDALAAAGVPAAAEIGAIVNGVAGAIRVLA